MLKNITFSADEDLIRKARERALAYRFASSPQAMRLKAAVDKAGL
jgi:hypothetical protein